MSEKKGRRGFSEASTGFAPDQQEDLGAQDRAIRVREAIDLGGGLASVVRQSGIPVSTLKRYQDGQEMRLGAAADLASACGVRLEWLATGKGPMRLDEASPDDPLDLGLASLTAALEIIERLQADAPPRARIEAALRAQQELRRITRAAPVLDVDVELLSGCLTLVEELARQRSRSPGSAYTRLKRALAIYRDVRAEEAADAASETDKSA